MTAVTITGKDGEKSTSELTTTFSPPIQASHIGTTSTAVCCLLRGSETQATLVERYVSPSSSLLVLAADPHCLACWLVSDPSLLPQYKFNQANNSNVSSNPSEIIIHATRGDLKGKRAYFSGICTWLRTAKTWNGSVLWFGRDVHGWECDLYFYCREQKQGGNQNQTRECHSMDTQQQTVLLKHNMEYPLYLADAVAIMPQGSDFLYSDPRFKCSIEKWVSEGSKLGFASKLDVRAGCALPNNPHHHSNINDRNVSVRNINNITSSISNTTVSNINNVENKSESIIVNDVKSKSEIISQQSSEECNNSPMLPGTPVYIRDEYYSWIPAIIESPKDDKKRIKVRVCLPDDWEESTVLQPHECAVNKCDFRKLQQRLVKLTDYPNDELPLQNTSLDNQSDNDHSKSSRLIVPGKNDMADLTHLHEAAILYNLKTRHVEGNPYTRVGDVMVAMNPFKWIDGLYSEEKQSFYSKSLIWNVPLIELQRKQIDTTMNNGALPRATAAIEKQALGFDFEKLGIPPHVYETSSLAYLGLAHDRINQAILVTGESGAGKTETIKIVMNYLATVERSRPSGAESLGDFGSESGSETVVNRILHANPLFEAFGNAKTLRNDNSSRFGKFTQLQFDVETRSDAVRGGRDVPRCRLVGSKCVTYLLEKSRVVSVSEGERTFHIFYQLFSATEEEKRKIWDDGLVGADMSDFTYLNNTIAEGIDGLASGDHWSETIESLSVFGIQGDVLLNIIRSLCIILQLGNLMFDCEVIGGEERSKISSLEDLEKLSNLMGVSETDIETAMTKRCIVTRGEEFTIALKLNEAKDSCDALAKEIYTRVFDFLVKKVNQCTESIKATTNIGTISLLDIFGFESFTINRFEQICINYANERLQQKYVHDIFQSVKMEYEEEGINIFDFSLIDNSDVMELLEGRLGLIAQLNEECVRPNGSDESFVYKLKVVNSDSNRLIQEKLHRPYEFGIRHYAAAITYDSRKFIERNLDKLPSDLLSCACKSSNSFIRDQFHCMSSQLNGSKLTSTLKKRSEATKDLVTSKFRAQLSSLISFLEESRTRYIRCIKPNKDMVPRVLDHSLTVSQLESAGLVTAILITRESFPNRLSYDLIMERFKFLAYKYSGCQLGSGDIKVDSELLLSCLLEGITVNTHKGRALPFTCGKTKVYFRVGALERIEIIRQDYYAQRAVQVQAWIRKIEIHRKFLQFKRGLVQFQCTSRRWIARIRFTKKLQCVIRIQCFIRSILSYLDLLRRRRNHASILIQARWRVIKPRRLFKNTRSATIRIQSLLRMVLCRQSYAVNKREFDEETAIDARMSMIQRNFDDASTIHGTVFSVDEGILEEVETMFEFLRKEIISLRKKNTKLKKQLIDSEEERRDMFNRASSVDHAFALSKIRNEQLTKTNAALLEDSNRRRKEINSLKNELKVQQQSHESQLNQMRSEFDLALAHREMRLQSLQANHHSMEAMHRRELQLLHDEADRRQEDNCTEISRLRNEIKKTQDVHQDYLSKLMTVLETSQANANNDLLQCKDAEIKALKDEVARLGIITGMESDEKTLETNAVEYLTSMRLLVKKNREHRKAHIQHLKTLINELEENLGSDVLSQSQQLFHFIRDAIRTAEKSNSKMDRDMVSMIDTSSKSYIRHTEGMISDGSVLHAENEKLRQKLEKRKASKKCGSHKHERKEAKSQDGNEEENC